MYLAEALGGFVLLGKLSLVASLIHFDGHGDQNGLVIGNSIYRTKRRILFQSIGVLVFRDNTHYQVDLLRKHYRDPPSQVSGSGVISLPAFSN